METGAEKKAKGFTLSLLYYLEIDSMENNSTQFLKQSRYRTPKEVYEACVVLGNMLTEDLIRLSYSNTISFPKLEGQSIALAD